MVSTINTPYADDTIEMLKKRVDPVASRQERWAMEEDMLCNMAFFSGKQNFYIDGGRIRDGTGDIPEHRVLYKVNLTRSAVLRAAAKVLAVHARFAAAPQTSSVRHRNIAETSEKVFEHLLRANEWDYRTSLLATMWAAICGSAFYKVQFDPLIGDVERFYWNDPQTKNVVPSAMLTEADKLEKDRDGLYEDLYKGDVSIQVASLFSIFHDWTSRDKSVMGCQWMAERLYVDKDLVADRFNVDPDDLLANETSLGLTNYEEAIAFMSPNANVSPFQWATPQDKRNQRCQMIDYWERPSRKHKKGRHVVYAGGKILIDKDNPYVGDRSRASHLPYIKQDWSSHPGRFRGSSLVEDLLSPQKHLNDARGCLLEFLRVFGRPATFIGNNSGLDPTNFTIDPGGVYFINEMSKGVTYGPVPQISSEIAGIGDKMLGDLSTIASQSDVDTSKLPGELRSGEAIRLMSEQRDMALNVSTMEYVRATRDVGRAALALAQMFYTKTRTLRYLGEDNNWAWIDFSNADLTNDLQIIGQPSALDSVSAQRAELLDAIQIGALDPKMNPDDKEYVLAALHYNTSELAINPKLKARKNQEREIRDMIGDPARYAGTEQATYPTQPYEDHATEAKVCIDFLYSEEARSLDPFTRSVITMHWKLHDDALKQQQQRQLEMMEAAKGMPGVPGQASQPAIA